MRKGLTRKDGLYNLNPKSKKLKILKNAAAQFSDYKIGRAFNGVQNSR